MPLSHTNKRFLYQRNWFLRLKKILKPSAFPSLNHLLELFSKESQNVFFIQIGANKMDYSDPLYSYIQLNKWRGILVEPQKQLFEVLEHKFSENPRIQLENIAISDQDGQKFFYCLSPKSKDVSLPNWVDQLNSFHEEVPQSVLSQLPNAKISHSLINCTTVSKLIEKYKIDQLDLLMIDTEGHDFIILSSLDFELIKPTVILYEHHFLNPKDDQKCIGLLQRKGYFLYREKFNTIAFKSLRIYNTYKDQLFK